MNKQTKMNKQTFPSVFRKQYKIPAGYFEQLEYRMRRKIRRNKWKKRLQIIAAASVAIIMLWIPFGKTFLSFSSGKPETDSLQVYSPGRNTTSTTATDFSGISDETIDAYLLSDADEW
jgi:hypothetical protein